MAVLDVTARRNVSEALVERFDYARKRARLYPSSHRYARESASAWLRILAEAFGESDAVTISVVDHELYVDGRLLPGLTLSRTALIHDLTERKLMGITFQRGLTPDELVEFFPLTSLAPEELARRGEWPHILERAGIQNIRVDMFVRKDEDNKPVPSGSQSGDRIKISSELYRKAIEAILQAYVDARAKKRINVEMVSGVVGTLVSSLMDSPDAVRLIAELKQRDEYTLSHSVNVAILSLLMGSKLKLPSPLMQKLGLAALLHDIGKASVPEDIINKPEQLSRREWDVMQSHALLGAKILAEQERMDPLAVVVAAEHHAREDLTGYPRFHAHKKLHAMSKIVAIADTYDALTSNRSYRRALLPDQAMRILIDGRGTHFDPSYLKVFVQLSGMYPVGTILELDSGDLAIVEKPNVTDIFRPVVKVVQEDGRKPKSYRLIDLSDRDPAGNYSTTAVRALDPDSVLIDLAEVF